MLCIIQTGQGDVHTFISSNMFHSVSIEQQMRSSPLHSLRQVFFEFNNSWQIPLLKFSFVFTTDLAKRAHLDWPTKLMTSMLSKLSELTFKGHIPANKQTNKPQCPS